MKRLILIFASACVALMLAAASPAAAPRHPFRGSWRGTDAWDGSNLTLWIVEESRSGGQVFEVRASDDRTGSWCGGPAQMRAVGVLESEHSIALSMVWWCLPEGSNVLYFFSDTLSYHPETDTITDSWGTLYSRGN